MNSLEIDKPNVAKKKFTDDEIVAIVKASPFIKEKVAESKRIISKLMEKYPDLEDRLSGKVPHP